ncbi:hypothetical protein, partial [Streptomyces glomeratus]
MTDPFTGSSFPSTGLQLLAEECRQQRVNSLVDLDLEPSPKGHYARRHSIAKAMLHYLRLVCFSREDTRDAGFIETEHFGVR